MSKRLLLACSISGNQTRCLVCKQNDYCLTELLRWSEFHLILEMALSLIMRFNASTLNQFIEASQPVLIFASLHAYKIYSVKTTHWQCDCLPDQANYIPVKCEFKFSASTFFTHPPNPVVGTMVLLGF